MGKKSGYLDFEREDPGYRHPDERLKDFEAVEKRLSNEEIERQAARCMDCGTPYCFSVGCPLGNIIPEFNDMVYRGEWEEALDLLLENSCFPEFTAAVCPAPCETACILNINDNPVTIRQIEREIIERGFAHGLIKPEPPSDRLPFKIAVVGSGPAGLAVAQVLNRSGCNVTVYEREPNVGGILRYGIPDFKLDKSILDRRIDLMRNEGVVFETNTSVGEDVSFDYLKSRFDAVCLTGGSRQPRDIPVPGRELRGIHFAMDYLVQQNRMLAFEEIEGEPISAQSKKVVVIGGGDTGSDCLGTALRQGAESVVQFEIMPRPPETRTPDNPWPEWPRILRQSSSQKEGGERQWCVATKEFIGDGQGNLKAIHCKKVEWEDSGDGYKMKEVPESDFEQAADLVLLAMGFTGPAGTDISGLESLDRDERGNILTDDCHMTSEDAVFSAGDIRRGQSLVVWAIADGRDAAEDILEYVSSNN